MLNLPNKDLLRVDEVATYYQVSIRTVYTWIELGKLKAVKVAGKIVRIKRNEAIKIQITKCE